MPIINGMNDAYVEYFSLEEYIRRIKLLPFVLEHLEETNTNFDDFMKKLSYYDKDYISNYFIHSLYVELQSTQAIENHYLDISLIEGENIFFDTLTINHKRIHNLHNYVLKKEINEGLYEESNLYRQTDVNVSRYNYTEKKEEIFWRGAQSKDVSKFMSDFIKVYRQSGLSLLYSNPFLYSALIHLLFVRIHPYIDGNGRTARIIHNIKFTEMVNKLYGTRLKISPLNLSRSLLINKQTYVNRLNNIYFDLENDTNYEINKWFNFMLDMADEQIYYSKNQLGKVNSFYVRTLDTQQESQALDSISLSRIKRIH
jgi:Fic family protein